MLGVYSEPAPEGTAIGSREMTPDVSPFGWYNEGVRRTLRLARWVTSVETELEDLMA